jgi:hypothetical protein
MALKVIGAGLGRTGTLSLKLALEQIGFGPCHHMAEVMLHLESVPLWTQAADGNPNWDAIYKDYAATVDYPGCAFWRQLTDFYPQAKVLLSVRDADQWFESTQATIFSADSINRLSGTPMRPFIEKTVWAKFGDRIHDRDFMIDMFRKHNAEVESTTSKDRLLVYDVNQGWEPLCKFLDVPVPATPFPRRNSREEMAAMMAAHSGGPGSTLDLTRMQEAIKDHLKRT